MFSSVLSNFKFRRIGIKHQQQLRAFHKRDFFLSCHSCIHSHTTIRMHPSWKQKDPLCIDLFKMKKIKPCGHWIDALESVHHLIAWMIPPLSPILHQTLNEESTETIRSTIAPEWVSLGSCNVKAPSWTSGFSGWNRKGTRVHLREIQTDIHGWQE